MSAAPAAATAAAPAAVLGTGRMGAAIARALLRAGHPVTVWNRSPGRTRPLADDGATPAATPAEAAAGAPLVVLCVTDHPAARQIIDEVGDAIADRTLVNVTCTTPDQARASAARIAKHRADYLAAPAMTDYRRIGMEQTVLLFSGPRAAFERHETALRALGGGGRHVGADPGLAPLFDMTMNGLFFEFWIGYLHTLALVRAEGVPAADFAVVAARVIQEIPPMLPMIAQQADSGDHDPSAYGDIAYLESLARPMIEMRRARGIDTERLQHLEDLMQRHIAAGHGREEGLTSLLATIESERDGQ
jgi:3-hydroxyisobutyrate dehydrogenase-like beta-hydroxyacid dehydrogenase